MKEYHYFYENEQTSYRFIHNDGILDAQYEYTIMVQMTRP